MPRTRPSRLAAGLLAITAALCSSGTVLAHDDIESSIPVHQSQFDEPISQATISFGAAVDGVELALVGPDNRDLPGTVTQVDDTTARIDFAPLSQQGEYIVRFLAEEDGHLIAGAITFVYGSRGGTGVNSGTWLAFGAVAVAILAIGLFFTLRRTKHEPQVDTPVSS